MKLTRYDLENNSMIHAGKLTPEEIEQILKNQEDAERYRELPADYLVYWEHKEIVERLKKRIEDIKPMTASDYLKLDLEEELQKILGEDNE